MIRVGLTGGIGSGKTTVARVLEQLGVPVYYADVRGQWLSDNDPEVRLKIKALFGEEAYRPEGSLDRAYIAGKVFADKALLERLNAIVHPAVRRDYRAWAARHEEEPYTVMETAILFESGFEREVQRVVVVTAPEELRIARTVRRDGSDETAVRARIAAQMSDDERLAKADDVLQANDRELLIPQILELHRQLSGL
ncbi:dephospho-CoA kinase [Alistipes sp. OttesenSCG-928-L06]|nr:dephospho-CoA kinase [Alistipes sp. OttesenSCG-928-L06]